MDPRITKAAHLLTHFCMQIKKGETALLSGSVLAEPWLKTVYAEVLKAGAFPIVRMSFADQEELFYKHAQKQHLTHLHPANASDAQNADVFLYIEAESNTKALSSVDPSRQALRAKAMAPLRKLRAHKRWALTLFPTAAFAQDAEMSLTEFEDFVYGAMFCDRPDPMKEWLKIKTIQDRLCKRLNSVDRVRIVATDTDIAFSVKGRRFINSYGVRNMPSGEVFTGPVENSVEGHVRFSYPVCRGGKEIEDVRLEFKQGRVVRASAAKNEDYLLKMLASDPGARRLGEFGIGNNYGIKRFIKNILFDEKIGGTIHLALGSSYPETGGKNQSSLHWDMILDLRRGGKIFLDGRLWQKDGRLA